MEDVTILVDPSTDKVLGVFGNTVHIKTNIHLYNPEKDEFDYEVAVVKTTKKEYLKMWKLWLEGKQNCCETANEYCGVMGEFQALEFQELPKTVYLNNYDEDDEEGEEEEVIRPRVFKVTKFDDYPNFEHG